MPPRFHRLPRLALRSGWVVAVACGGRARLRGLAGLRSPPVGVALLLTPCRSVHTCGMRFALDLVWLGPGGVVLRVDPGVQPWRVRSCRRACGVLEAAAGDGASLADELRSASLADELRSASLVDELRSASLVHELRH